MGYLKVTTDVSHFSGHPLYQIISQIELIKQLKTFLALATSILGQEIPLNQLKIFWKKFSVTECSSIKRYQA